MEDTPKDGTILVLKRDFPPCPVGTEFTVSHNCIDRRMIVHTPTFGSELPNGSVIPSSSVNGFYAEVFDKFGGWTEWFETKRRKVKDWSCHTITFDGLPLTDDDVKKISEIIEQQ